MQDRQSVGFHQHILIMYYVIVLGIMGIMNTEYYSFLLSKNKDIELY